ncbi:MAG: succinate dehydrogenase [Bryobacteraceae bacterium]
MSSIDVPLKKGGFGSTSRTDNWWVEPLLVFLGYLAFILYANWALFEAKEYHYVGGGADYLSPMYSPMLTEEGPVSANGLTTDPGPAPSFWPSFVKFSPAMLILVFPLAFRFTCYYYRGAYYKAWWADPPSCAVGEPRKTYLGERYFPLIIQNAHRYALYFAIIFIALLAWDGWKALWFLGTDGERHFGVGVGSLVLILNPILLGLYTFGCHSMRHLVGGRKDVLSDSPTRKKCYDCVSGLNKKHMLYAWVSMFYVGFVDIYVRMCAKGVWTDLRIF